MVKEILELSVYLTIYVVGDQYRKSRKYIDVNLHLCVGSVWRKIVASMF